MRVAQELTLTQCLKLTGGSTDSIFPEVEALLSASSEYQKALDYAAKRKNANKYRSVIDFLCMELFPHLKAGCFRFYLTGKKPLREIITESQRVQIAWHMLQALVIAYAAFCEDRRLSWTQLRKETLNAA
jgi:hypothetical protein